MRPTYDRVRESVFGILGPRVEGARVLDLFAGSGAVGIEALSRGAAHAVFVEEWDKACEAIRRNLTHCKLTSRGRILRCTVESAIRKLHRDKESFNLIFVDPPYLKGLVSPTLRKLAASSIAAPDALIIVEHHPKEVIPEIEGLTLTDSRKYGQTLITFLARTVSTS